MTEHYADRADGQQTVDWMAEARRFAKAGIPVFPIKIRFDAAKQKWLKTPLTGNGFFNASTDIDRFGWSEANGFGARMGDGVFMVDVDDQDPNGKPMKWLKERGLDLLPTRKHRTVSGGEHWFYKLPEAHRNLPGGQNIDGDLDTRGDGGYAAFGEGYEVIDRTSAAELPTPVCEELQARWNQKNLGSTANKPMRPWSKPEGADETLDELLLKDPDLKHRFEGGADGLDDTSRSGFDLSIARRLATHGCTYDLTVWAIMERAAITTGDERQIMRCALKAEKTAGADDFEKIEGAEAVASSLSSENEDDEDIFGGAPPAAASGASSTRKHPLDVALATAVAGTTGLIDALMDYTEAKSRNMGRDHYILAALASVAANSAGRFVVDRKAGLTALNIQTVLLAPSGAGKEDARRTAKLGADAHRMVWADDFTSGPSLQQCLAEHDGRVLWLNDEYHEMVEASLRPKGSPHKRTLSTLAMKAYGLALDGLSEYRAKRGEDTIPAVPHPFLVALHTTPGMQLLMGSYRTKDMENGVLNRPIFLETHIEAKRHPDSHVAPRTVPTAITNAQQWIVQVGRHTGALGPVTTGGGDPNNPPMQPEVIRAGEAGSQFRAVPIRPDDAAEALLLEWHDETEVKTNAGAPTAPLWRRAMENALKVAGLVALSEIAMKAPATFTGAIPMTAHHARWAIKFIRHCVEAQCRAADLHIADSRYEADTREIVRALVDLGGKGTKRDITRKTRSLGGNRRDEALSELGVTGEVLLEKKPTKGRAAEVYHLRNWKDRVTA